MIVYGNPTLFWNGGSKGWSFHWPLVFSSSDDDSSDDEADEDGDRDEDVEDKWGELVRLKGIHLILLRIP